MFRMIGVAAGLALSFATVASDVGAAESTEQAEVAREACGADPQGKCLAELRKVCHDHFTFRCYYSRKGRLDAIREVGFPQDRVHVIDE